MKKLCLTALVALCSTALVPAAFAADTPAPKHKTTKKAAPKKKAPAKKATVAAAPAQPDEGSELWSCKDNERLFLKGDMKALAYFKEKARRSKLQFEVILVQPGASRQTVTEDSLRLLATTELYLVKTTEAAFRVIVSA